MATLALTCPADLHSSRACSFHIPEEDYLTNIRPSPSQETLCLSTRHYNSCHLLPQAQLFSNKSIPNSLKPPLVSVFQSITSFALTPLSPLRRKVSAFCQNSNNALNHLLSHHDIVSVFCSKRQNALRLIISKARLLSVFCLKRPNTLLS